MIDAQTPDQDTPLVSPAPPESVELRSLAPSYILSTTRLM